MVIDLLSNYRYREINRLSQINKKNLKMNDLGSFSADGFRILNKLYKELKKSAASERYITDSGGLGLGGIHLGLPSYWIRWTYGGYKEDAPRSVELYIYTVNRLYGFIIGNPRKDSTESGFRNFCRFKEACDAIGLNLDKYALKEDEAIKVKESISSPLIMTIDTLFPSTLKWNKFTGVNHIDIHEAYRAGLCNSYPEFNKVFNEIDKLYPEHDKNKLIANLTIGYMQSKYLTPKYKFAELSKAAITWCKNTILDIRDSIFKKHGIILGYNTDGLFYVLPTGGQYHGPGEGDKVGNWHNDMTNMEWVGIGANWVCLDGYKNGHRGFYKAMRGFYKYSFEKRQEDWNSWEDILKALQSEQTCLVGFDKEKGFTIDQIASPVVSDKLINSNQFIDKTKEYLKGGISL